MDWFLYDNGLRHERVNSNNRKLFTELSAFLRKTHLTMNKLHPLIQLIFIVSNLLKI